MPARPHWTGLDLIRVLPILTVAAYHLGVESATAGVFDAWVFTTPQCADLIRLAVFLMVLLSGAGLGAKYATRPLAPAEYLRSRAAAIYPLFWAIFVPVFVYSDVIHRNNAGVPWWKVVFSLMGIDGYLQAYTPTFYKIGEWYLGCQVFLYCLFPLTWLALRRPAGRVAVGAAAAGLWCAGPWLCPAGVDWFHTVWGEWPVFVLGMVFGGALGHRRRGVVLAGVCLAAAAVCGAAGLPAYQVLSLLAGAVFWALFWLGQALGPGAARALGMLARESYGVFLIHHIFITLVWLRVMARLPMAPLTWALCLVVCLALCFALAWCERKAVAPLTAALRPKRE